MDGLLLVDEQSAGAGVVSSDRAAPTVRTVVVDVTAVVDDTLVGDTWPVAVRRELMAGRPPDPEEGEPSRQAGAEDDQPPGHRRQPVTDTVTGVIGATGAVAELKVSVRLAVAVPSAGMTAVWPLP